MIANQRDTAIADADEFPADLIDLEDSEALDEDSPIAGLPIANPKFCAEGERSESNFAGVVGQSAALREALELVEMVAPTDSTVPLLGETGTGKELIARAIHERSRRRNRALIKLNCATIPAGLLESELFHRRDHTEGWPSRTGRS